MTEADLQAKCEFIVAEAVGNLPEGIKWPQDLGFTYVFFRNSRMAGRARGTRRIEINADLAELYPEQLRDTVLHELAHLLVHMNYGHRQPRCKPHGPEWQDMMEILGVEPEVCHRMHQPDLKVRRHNTFPYQCGCRTHLIKTGRHNKIQMYGKSYRCRSCGDTLEYVG